MSTSQATERRLLREGWRVREADKPNASPATALPWMPATVPGNIHLDLMRAGVIADPFYRMMERGVGWVDEADWVYETTFTVDDLSPNAYLTFKGLDTIADIALNGEALASTDNMFVEHEFPVTDRLREGENTLTITFHSALRVGRERRAAWAAAGEDAMEPAWFEYGPRSFVRKAQYMYGWDWGPEPVSGGIWRDVELVSVPMARFLDWRHEVEFHEDGRATVHFEVFVERAPQHAHTPLTFALTAAWLHDENGNLQPTGLESVTIRVPEGEGRVSVSTDLEIADPVLWRPNMPDAEGRCGFAALYDIRMLLLPTEKEVGLLDELSARIGLRTIELIREPDEDGNGESFKFRVNGEDVFIKGANWIPADSFPGRLPNESTLGADVGTTGAPTAETSMSRLVALARDAGHNMLRVWGGGLYECDHFYETCDALGLLVWQDFPYACAYYPDRGEYLDVAREEAIRAVRRLRNHASLALWCGNNENWMMYEQRWTGDNTPQRLLGEPIYLEVLPDVLAGEDPTRPYWPSSPFGGPDANSEEYGDRHNWEVWHSGTEPGRFNGDWPGYADDRARFCSEFGFASSCGMTAWDTVLDERDKNPHSAAVRWHDKTRKGYDTYMRYITLHYPEPQTLSDLVYYSQCNQAEALKFGVEHYRRLKGHCWGTLYWQINDCWPSQSWATVDYVGQPKAAWYASKRFYAPRLLSLKRTEDGGVEAHLTNDRMEPARGTVTLCVETFEGEKLTDASSDCDVAANGTSLVATLSLEAARGLEREACVFARFTPDDGSEPTENILLLAEPKDLRFADPGLRIEVSENRVTVSARRFAPYVWLRLIGLVGKAPPIWEDNFFHLRPGESRTVAVNTPYPLTAEEIYARLTVRTL